MHKSPQLSLVIPIFNEADVIPLLFSELNDFKKTLPTATELVLVDDGSSDQSFELLKNTKLQFPKKIIRLSRNFGHQGALLAGLKAAKGVYIVTMDADLQHPLAVIPQMIAQHDQGIDIVLTQRFDSNAVPLLKRSTSRWFYTFINSISQLQINANASDFRSMNRRSLTALLSLPEKRKFLRGIVKWVGFSQVIIPFEVKARVKGQSKYTWLKMVNLALHGITSFSTLPLYLSAIFGGILFILALLYALYVLYIRLVVGAAVEGWASVLFVLLVVGGFISLFLGLAGLYIAAIYDEVKQRPNFIIADQYEA